MYLSYSGVGEAGNLVLGISVFCFFETPLGFLSLNVTEVIPDLLSLFLAVNEIKTIFILNR